MSEQAAPAALDPATIPIDKLAKMYLKMRDRLSELTRIYDAETESIKAQQAIVTHAMKDKIRALGDGVNSVKTDFGLVMLQTKTRYYATEWDAFGAFVVAQGNTSLLERRVAQTNMAQFLEQHPGVTPPGLSSTSEIEVIVRRPRAAA